MNTAASTDAPADPQPRLRLVHDAHASHSHSSHHDELLAAQSSAPAERLTHVLVAGSDADGRSRMLGELRGLLPASTAFLEACETWEVLARAAGSRMVVLTDDLSDISAGSLARLLGRRHPTLPVLAVGTRSGASVPGDVGAPTA